MSTAIVEIKFNFSKSKLKQFGLILIKNWLGLLLASGIGVAFGYFISRQIATRYTATFNFVLLTDQYVNPASKLMSQLGADADDETQNVFAGRNILDFFKSRSLIGAALLSKTTSLKPQLLINLIAEKHFQGDFKTAGIFGNDPAKYSHEQIRLYHNIINFARDEFNVIKKDKKLVFYLINATDTDPEIAYNLPKNILSETSKSFSETQTRATRENVRLLTHAVDSMSDVLTKLYRSYDMVNDHTFNANPSLSIQSTGSYMIQSKATVLTQGYQQLIISLESAKMNLKRGTPLYQIIDTPELPLEGINPNFSLFMLVGGAATFLVFLIAIIIKERYLINVTMI